MSGAVHHRPHQRRRHHRHWAEHDSPLCAAFLVALARWVLKHQNDSEAQVVLPTGPVTCEQLVQVLRALEISRRVGAQ
jgi:hypothetical protein